MAEVHLVLLECSVKKNQSIKIKKSLGKYNFKEKILTRYCAVLQFVIVSFCVCACTCARVPAFHYLQICIRHALQKDFQ